MTIRKPARLLLVDDDPGLLKLLGMRLVSEGYSVVTAESGPEALRVLGREKVDLVISDLRMDEMDGLQLFSEIQKGHPGMPVIILTAHGSIPDAVAATQQGVFSFLTKPVDKDALYKAIDEALKKLNIGYIDMMLLHHPAANDSAAYSAIEKAMRKGKVRNAGISCYYIQETNSFLPKVSIKPALIQNEIHPYYQDSQVIEHIQNKGIVVQGWYPLGGRGYVRAMLDDPLLKEIAAAHRKSVAQVILRWHVQKGVCVIPGSSDPKHIQENISIFDFALTDQEMGSIAMLDKKEKHDWY